MESRLNLGKDLYIKGRIGWKGLNKDEYLDFSDYKIINATALMDGYVDWNNCGYITKERYDESEEIQLKENDILISKDGTIGKIGYIKNMEGSCTVASGIFVVRNMIPERLDFDYLYHVLKSNIFKDFIRRNKAEGSTINHLYQRDLENFELDIPDISVQRKIAKILNDLDEKISNNNRINDNLQQLAETIYNYWFVQFEFPDENGKPYKSSGGQMVWNEKLKRMIPIKWETTYVDEAIKPAPSLGSIKAPDYLEEGIYPIVDQAEKLITGYTNDDSYVYDNPNGCVVFGDVTKYFKFVNFKFAKGTDGTKIMEAKDNRIPSLLLYHLLKHANLPNIGFARHYMYLREYKFLLPPIDICKKYNDITSPLMKKYADNLKENQQLIKLRKWLLPLLMNGQITIE